MPASEPASIFGLLAGEKRLTLHQATLHAWGIHSRGVSLPEEQFDVGSPSFVIQRQRNNITREAGAEITYEVGTNSLVLGFDYLDSADAGDRIEEVDRQTGARSARNTPIGIDLTNLGLFAQAILRP